MHKERATTPQTFIFYNWFVKTLGASRGGITVSYIGSSLEIK